ncbi:hypothetical protein [Salinisphaera sp. LB1]|uniref:hypothetical protein n=1 Tax=Salinisphaera sp. LB1 TaxID=2183911 RepID=UPI000D705214|nr:hypothetical protein [Salinisphaera sp. LB1]AWN16972.1 hypothetical protein SALB1_2776 [Salinisphaera sp. LB1]
MTTATVVLVAHTALDVDAARRLADYGALDDAGVARALEQVHMQRWGRADLPGHLCRIERLAAVVDDGYALSLIGPAGAHERDRLGALFDAWPSGAVAVVDWDGVARALLAARALIHDMPLPAGFSATAACALGERVAPAPADHPAPSARLELECLRLMAGLGATDQPAPAARAIARYRLWLRWQYVTGTVDAGDRAAREARLAELRIGDGA